MIIAFMKAAISKRKMMNTDKIVNEDDIKAFKTKLDKISVKIYSRLLIPLVLASFLVYFLIIIPKIHNQVSNIAWKITIMIETVVLSFLTAI